MGADLGPTGGVSLGSVSSLFGRNDAVQLDSFKQELEFDTHP